VKPDAAPGGVAWVLNLDAEEELRQGDSYRRSPRMVAHIRGLVGRLGGLVREEDRVLEAGQVAEGWPGRSWCPTRSARRVLGEAAAVVADAPSEDVLARVNSRSFAFDSEECHLPGARLIRVGEEGLDAGPGEWVLKRELGFAGRGMRRVELPLDAPATRWLEARLEEDGVVLLEPWVERLVDVGLHGWVGRSGECLLGEPTVQVCDPRGRWEATRRAGTEDLRPAEVEALRSAAEGVATALARAGYHGPFGIDGYRWQCPERGERFRALGEVNARFSMGWAIGTGEAGRGWILQDP
jgi:hypothetical protein